MEHSKHAPFRGAPTESHRKGRFEHMSDESPITDISKEGGQLHNMAFSDVSVSPTSTNLSQPVKPKTSLLSIPPELRLKIHGHVIIAAEPIKVYRSLKRLPGSISLEYTSAQPPLTRVCRQIRRETLPVFYSENEFRANDYDGEVTSQDRALVGAWYRRIGELNRALLADSLFKQKCEEYMTEYLDLRSMALRPFDGESRENLEEVIRKHEKKIVRKYMRGKYGGPDLEYGSVWWPEEGV